MTLEEAIKEIQSIEYYGRPFDNSVEETNKADRKRQALDMAIKALEQEPKETWSIKDVATTFERHGLMTEQEPCEGCDYKEWLKGEVEPKTDVLDKIRAEIHATAELHEDGDYYLRDEWIDEIFDDYKAESEGKEWRLINLPTRAFRHFVTMKIITMQNSILKVGMMLWILYFQKQKGNERWNL